MKTAVPELYKPAEACRVAEVAPYVLRYWETEFPALSEGKEKGAARLYTGRDVRIIGRIRELLYDEGFTVAGAKKRLEAEISEGRFDEDWEPAPSVAEQKKSAKPAATLDESTLPAFLLDAPPVKPAPTPMKPAPPPLPVSASKRAGPTGEFSDRKRVLKELKEIAKLLDRSYPAR
jgi:DNA-binding transcriptional MerR regulator